MKRSELLNAGLGRAVREGRGPCKPRHGRYYREGDKFCRDCGLEIKPYRSCPTCGNLFFSKGSFVFHAREHKHRIICPVCGKPAKFSANQANIRRLPHKVNVYRCWSCLSFLERYWKHGLLHYKQISQKKADHVVEGWRPAKELFPEYAPKGETDDKNKNEKDA